MQWITLSLLFKKKKLNLKSNYCNLIIIIIITDKNDNFKRKLFFYYSLLMKPNKRADVHRQGICKF